MHTLVILTALLAVANAARLPLIQPHIMGGKWVSVDRHPYQVILRGYEKYQCGATVISSNQVLTAAHCFGWKQHGIGWFNIQSGVSNRFEAHEGQTHKLAGVVRHPQYVDHAVEYDIAIIVLKEPIQFNLVVQRIQMVPKLEEPQPGEKLTVSGWGARKMGHKAAQFLQAVRITVISRDQCQEIFSPITITENMICAGGNNIGTTNGDSGGPLVNADKKLVGIVSFTDTLPDRNTAPQIFTNIASPAIRDFIDDYLF